MSLYCEENDLECGFGQDDMESDQIANILKCECDAEFDGLETVCKNCGQKRPYGSVGRPPPITPRTEALINCARQDEAMLDATRGEINEVVHAAGPDGCARAAAMAVQEHRAVGRGELDTKIGMLPRAPHYLEGGPPPPKIGDGRRLGVKMHKGMGPKPMKEKKYPFPKKGGGGVFSKESAPPIPPAPPPLSDEEDEDDMTADAGGGLESYNAQRLRTRESLSNPIDRELSFEMIEHSNIPPVVASVPRKKKKGPQYTPEMMKIFQWRKLSQNQSLGVTVCKLFGKDRDLVENLCEDIDQLERSCKQKSRAKLLTIGAISRGNMWRLENKALGRMRLTPRFLAAISKLRKRRWVRGLNKEQRRMFPFALEELRLLEIIVRADEFVKSKKRGGRKTRRKARRKTRRKARRKKRKTRQRKKRNRTHKNLWDEFYEKIGEETPVKEWDESGSDSSSFYGGGFPPAKRGVNFNATREDDVGILNISVTGIKWEIDGVPPEKPWLWKDINSVKIDKNTVNIEVFSQNYIFRLDDSVKTTKFLKLVKDSSPATKVRDKN